MDDSVYRRRRHHVVPSVDEAAGRYCWCRFSVVLALSVGTETSTSEDRERWRVPAEQPLGDCCQVVSAPTTYFADDLEDVSSCGWQIARTTINLAPECPMCRCVIGEPTYVSGERVSRPIIGSDSGDKPVRVEWTGLVIPDITIPRGRFQSLLSRPTYFESLLFAVELFLASERPISHQMAERCPVESTCLWYPVSHETYTQTFDR